MSSAARLLRLACLVITGAFSQPAASQVTSTCNNVARNVTIGDNSSFIQVVDCVPVDPAKSFSIRYVWLDATNVSFLLSGYNEKLLSAIVGYPAVVLRNPIYDRIQTLYRDYGERIASTTFPNFFARFNSNLLGSTGGLLSSNTEFEEVSDAIRRRMRFYTGEKNIIWPELAASADLARTRALPSGWRLTYTESGDGISPTRPIDALNCTMLYQPVSANELENYWQKVNEVKRAILSKSLKEDFTVTEKHYGLFDQTAMVSGNKTVEAVKALADGGSWPADYLFKYGSFSLDGCGKNIFGFVAVPRKLFVLVAIVKAERASVSIDGVDYLADKGGGLRTQINETESVRDRFPEQTISKDRSLIIPLRLDLRYDLDEEPISRIIENKLSIAQQRAITKIPNSVFSAVIGGRTIAKSKDSFGQPQFMQVNRAYTSGEARSLQSIVVDGTSYPVKPAPRTALVSVGELDGGSCPFLMVKESDGDWSLQGRVLVGANQRSLARSEAVKLPVDTSDIRIEEREPEITYISTIKIRYSGLQEAELASSVILQPGESLSLKLPRAADNETTLMLTGYYRTTTD